MKVQEVIDYCNENTIYTLWDIEDRLPDLEPITGGLELDEHRWYSTAVNIFKCEDGYVGIRGAYQSFSEMQGWLDIDYECRASEYKPIETITYIRK